MAMVRAIYKGGVPFIKPGIVFKGESGIFTNAGAPTNGTSGTGANRFGPGSLLEDTTNKNLYINTNTMASPTWQLIAGVTVSGTASSVAASTSTVAAGYAADTYLAGSGVTVPASGVPALATYECVFDMVKTAAGTAAPVITLRYGTAGTTADAALLTFTFGAGTAAADTGVMLVRAHFRTVGAGAAAVVVGLAEIRHALAATGLTSTGAAGIGAIVNQVSAGFDSTPAASIMGVSFNGGAAFSGTNSLVEANLRSV